MLRCAVRIHLKIASAVIFTSASLLLSLPAASAEVRRTGWVPNVGALEEGEPPLGDLWIFRCPRGGTFTIRVDTKDDDDQGGAGIDPVLRVLSGSGRVVAVGDDEQACTYEPLCGFGCPLVEASPCGPGVIHSIIIQDRGDLTRTNERCRGGGGYELVLEVFRANGLPLPQGSVQLGGGAAALSQPRWLGAAGFALHGPRLDDTALP